MAALSQGKAFALAADASWPADGDASPSGDLAYPVAVGIAAARHKIPLGPTLAAYLHAFVANLVSAGI